MTTLTESSEPLIITQNGETKAVIQNIDTYEEKQETLALLIILALGQKQLEAGQVTDVKEMVKRLKSKRKKTLCLSIKTF